MHLNRKFPLRSEADPDEQKHLHHDERRNRLLESAADQPERIL